VIFPALAMIALAGFVFGVAIGRWYVGTAVAVALWAAFVLLHRRQQLRRSRP
jgi:uncharacterized membrane protein YdjX (TVP38/TMEM64 family)